MVLDEDIGSSVLAYSAGHVGAGVIDVKYVRMCICAYVRRIWNSCRAICSGTSLIRTPLIRKPQHPDIILRNGISEC